jgi:hypothetical protein
MIELPLANIEKWETRAVFKKTAIAHCIHTKVKEKYY